MVRVTTQMEVGESPPPSPDERNLPPPSPYGLNDTIIIDDDDDCEMQQVSASQRDDEFLIDLVSEDDYGTNDEDVEFLREIVNNDDYTIVHIYGGNEEMDAKMQEIRDANQDEEKGLVIIRHPVKPEPPPELVFPDDVFDNQIESAKDMFNYFEMDEESKEKKLLHAFAFGPTQVNYFMITCLYTCIIY